MQNPISMIKFRYINIQWKDLNVDMNIFFLMNKLPHFYYYIFHKFVKECFINALMNLKKTIFLRLENKKVNKYL